MGGPNSGIFVNTKMATNSIVWGLRFNYSILKARIFDTARLSEKVFIWPCNGKPIIRNHI